MDKADTFEHEQWISCSFDFDNDKREWVPTDCVLPAEYKHLLNLRHGVTSAAAFVHRTQWRTMGEILAYIALYDQQVGITRDRVVVEKEVREQLNVLEKYGFVKYKKLEGLQTC